MRFRRLSLRNFRGIDACDIEFLPAGTATGITIVEGPNEAGKSSLVEAIRLLWDFPHSSRHRDVRDVQPVGRDVATRIELHVDAAGVELTYAKTFNRDAGAELTVRGTRTMHLTGKEAHERANTLLEDLVDTRLWRALQAPQGVIAQAELGDTAALSSALLHDRAGGPTLPRSGQGIVDDRDLAIADGILAQRRRWRTDAGRDRKPLVDLATRVERLRHDRDAAQAILDAVASELREIERLRLGLPEHRAAVTASSRDLAITGEKLAVIEELEGRLDELNRLIDHATNVAEHARQAEAERQELIAEHGQAARDVEEAQAGSTSAAAVAAARSAHDGALQALEGTEEEWAHARQRADEARAGFEMLRDSRELAALRDRQARLSELNTRIARAEETITAARIDDGVMEKLQAADRAVVEAEAALSVRAASVAIVALSATDVAIGEQSRHLSPGDEVTIVADHDTTARIGDVASISVRPGLDAALVSAADEARRNRQRLLDTVGVATLDEAESAHAARTKALQERAGAMAERDGLHDGRDHEQRAREIAGLERRVHGVQEAHGPDRGHAMIPRDAGGAADLAAARRACDEAERAASLADDQREQARADVEEARRRLDGLQASEERARVDRRVAERALEQATARLQRARAVCDDATITASRRQCDREVDDLRAARVAARRELDAQDGDALRDLHASLQSATRAGAERISADERRLSALESAVAARSADGPRSRRDDVQAQLDLADAELRRCRAHAEAAALIEEVFERHRAEQRRRYLAPLRERIERLGGLLWGSSFAIELDDDLRIRTRIIDGQALSFEQLSLGAQEQLALIGRLACAMVVGPDGAPLIVDDALGFSDPDKLRRMGAVLSVAGRSCQILLLTCHPQRYLHVTGARTVQMPRATHRVGPTPNPGSTAAA